MFTHTQVVPEILPKSLWKGAGEDGEGEGGNRFMCYVKKSVVCQFNLSNKNTNKF